jgi:chromosome segregation ATPase
LNGWGGKSMSDDLLLKILDKLDGMDSELRDSRAETKSRFDTLEAKMSLIKDDVSSVKQDVSDIKSTVTLLAAEAPEDVIGLLKKINTKLDTNQDLAHKVEDLEMDLKIIKKAISHQ